MSLNDYQLGIDTTGLVLGAGTDYIVHGWDGMGLPGMRDSDRARPFDHGVFLGPEYVEARQITIPLTIRGDDATDAQTKLDALQQAWYFDSRAASTYGEGTLLSVKLPGHDQRRITGRPRSLKPDLTRLLTGRVPVVLEFIAGDPRWYNDLVLRTAALNVTAATSGRGYDRSFDYGYGGGSSSGVICTNAGSFPTAPTLRLDGPLTNVTVANETTGKTLTITYTLGSGEYLEIDFAAKTVMLGGTASRYYAKSGDWWELVPGDNIVRLNQQSGSGNGTLSWRDAWI